MNNKISLITLHIAFLFLMFLIIILGKSENELERVKKLCLDFVEVIKEVEE